MMMLIFCDSPGSLLNICDQNFVVINIVFIQIISHSLPDQKIKRYFPQMQQHILSIGEHRMMMNVVQDCQAENKHNMKSQHYHVSFLFFNCPRKFFHSFFSGRSFLEVCSLVPGYNFPRLRQVCYQAGVIVCRFTTPFSKYDSPLTSLAYHSLYVASFS